MPLPLRVPSNLSMVMYRVEMKMKYRHDKSRVKSTEFNEGSIVYMKTASSAIGESTKLQPKYRGPLVIAKKWPGDTYHVTDLNDSAKEKRYASTAHAIQLKLWKPSIEESSDKSDDEEETSANEEVEPTKTKPPDRSAESEKNKVISVGGRAQRTKRVPSHLQDYEM